MVIDSLPTLRALEYAKQLYSTFVPGTSSWLDPNNNKAFLDGQISITNNGISIYYATKNSPDPKVKEMAADIQHAPFPIGPVGTPTESHNMVTGGCGGKLLRAASASGSRVAAQAESPGASALPPRHPALRQPPTWPRWPLSSRSPSKPPSTLITQPKPAAAAAVAAAVRVACHCGTESTSVSFGDHAAQCVDEPGFGSVEPSGSHSTCSVPGTWPTYSRSKAVRRSTILAAPSCRPGVRFLPSCHVAGIAAAACRRCG